MHVKAERDRDSMCVGGRNEIILLTDNIQMNVMRHVRCCRNLKRNEIERTKNRREKEKRWEKVNKY